ncbi:30S ribosomal protein S11 [Patescibacteria group bacterium]|nr:30S ribosomal protein S11 [Patescibacteria group bacterium]
MSEEKNLNIKEDELDVTVSAISTDEKVSEVKEEQSVAKTKTEAAKVPNVKEDADEDRAFSLDSSADDELPDEIKQKLEKNKQARAKKKLVKKRKKRTARTVKVGNAYINATYNNTMVTLADTNGDVISWASAGMAGFKGAKKATPYASQIITKIAVQKAKEEYGLQEVSVFVSGVGTGREAAIRALNANGLEVSSIKDTTSVPHNGCRPKKPRRV